MELVDGQLVEKTGITLRHAQIQARLAFCWKNYYLLRRKPWNLVI
jgi:hypothetical protein